MREEEMDKLRGVVRDCVSKHLYSSAIFFADKVAAFTGDPADIYTQAQALFLGRHFRRAFHLLNASKIVLRDLRFRYLAAKCLEELKEWDQCLLMLGEAKVDEQGNVYDTKDSNVIYLDKDSEDRENNISSAICFLRGRAYEAVENRAESRLWYKAAIGADPLCYEALECLIENHMLTCEEETSLLSSLQFDPEDDWLSAFYSCLIKKYDREASIEAKFREIEKESCDNKYSGLPSSHTLKSNVDLLACKAEYYHQCGEYQKCFELTSTLLEKDPFHLKCTLVHLAERLPSKVKDYPQKALSWFAVGCYYYSIKKYGQSRRYFSKATGLDGIFAPAWIGYGNAYAAQDEGDQAMSAYRIAARLFPGCHLQTLYIGMEYQRIHSFKLAEQLHVKGRTLYAKNVPSESIGVLKDNLCHDSHLFCVFDQARNICPSDPLVYNELGVVAYSMKEYTNALLWFEKTLAYIPALGILWEPTVVNLAHTYRKLKMYPEAISCYQKALNLSTRSSSTFVGLAYTCHIQGDFTNAITYYHKALWLKPDDQFCIQMLSLALLDESQHGIDSK